MGKKKIKMICNEYINDNELEHEIIESDIKMLVYVNLFINVLYNFLVIFK